MTTHGITREAGQSAGYGLAYEQYEAIVKQLREKPAADARENRKAGGA